MDLDYPGFFQTWERAVANPGFPWVVSPVDLDNSRSLPPQEGLRW